MTNKMQILSPKQLKAAVREANYPNSQLERETIAAADKAADTVVHRHTVLLREEAAERIEEGAAMLRIADELNSAMVSDVRVELSRGMNPAKLAATYERIEKGVQDLIAELRHEADRADLLADRLDNPEDDYERILDRFPALKVGVQW